MDAAGRGGDARRRERGGLRLTEAGRLALDYAETIGRAGHLAGDGDRLPQVIRRHARPGEFAVDMLVDYEPVGTEDGQPMTKMEDFILPIYRFAESLG